MMNLLKGASRFYCVSNPLESQFDGISFFTAIFTVTPERVKVEHSNLLYVVPYSSKSGDSRFLKINERDGEVDGPCRMSHFGFRFLAVT